VLERQKFVKEFEICQQQKYSATTSGLLQPLPIPTLIWSEISTDSITSLLKSNGYEAVSVVLVSIFSYSILSDCDPLFVSIFCKKLFKHQGTVLKMSSSYHPQTEVVNRFLEAYSRCFTLAKILASLASLD